MADNISIKELPQGFLAKNNTVILGTFVSNYLLKLHVTGTWVYLDISMIKLRLKVEKI